uniref:tRNA-2-methylthio-N(6)-dimethylallyladenosine synthase n=1 Tax=Chlorobium chlorochromatii (strain CaD3) TaxID=340177 RepID=MIAB_CHLCH|nr:RecName: Full=tRNA-2-methylthio-N(6)-dimethylallyladenosine synthase; AltName: Full=(Dimethylallyl)adenosine tRNA methylthiotransferase MiaB; AltName: Full=tRNA-i(6)A37 methylthiotransferase [Chlorobium chlorochromatii CaD3]
MTNANPDAFYIHTFGCQMNQADSGIMTAILQNEGYVAASNEADAGIVLLNTCAVREHATERVGHLLQHLHGRKKRSKGRLLVGVTGCIPQYEREVLFKNYPVVDFLAGPDTYRSLPLLIKQVQQAGKGATEAALAFNSAETYDGIEPVRSSSMSAFVPVMRGCNNHCAYCVVPLTRGRERSHPKAAVLNEVRQLAEAGYREITLLGQNVNSYYDPLAQCNFAELLAAVSCAAPATRIRFTTSHPKDISEALVRTIAEHSNICNHIHLPVQSGSSRILRLMQRGHTIEEYLEKIALIRSLIPNVTLSTDMIAGFCGETEADHQATLRLLEEVQFDSAFMFYYSPRPRTPAAEKLTDDVPEALKKARLQEIIECQNRISASLFSQAVGSVVEVLAEAESRRSSEQLMGRTAGNRTVVFARNGYQAGDVLHVRITGSTSATLLGEPLISTTL